MNYLGTITIKGLLALLAALAMITLATIIGGLR